MKWILILSFLVSCNALKTLTSGETEIPDGFNEGFQSDSLVFYSCSAEYCVFDTETEQSYQISSSVALTVQEKAAWFGDSVILTGGGKLLKYYPGSPSASIIEPSNVAKSFGIVNGFIYYVESDDLHRYDGNTVTQIGSGGIVPMTYTVAGSNGRVFICRPDGSDYVQEVNLSTGAAVNLAATASSGGGAVAAFQCSSSIPMMTSENSLITSNGNIIQHYQLNSAFLENTVSVGGSGSLKFNIPGKALYFHEGAGPYTLNRYDIQSRSVQTLHTDSSWNSRYVAEMANGKIYFMAKDSSYDELFEYDFSTNTSTKMSNFAGAFGALSTVVNGSKALYLFGSSGIYKVDYESKSISQVSTNAYDNLTFSVINKK